MNSFFALMSLLLIATTGGESFAQPPVYGQRSYIKNGESEAFFIKNMVVRHVSL